MGRAALQKPARLAEKLSEIRQRLELSQNGLIRFLGFNDCFILYVVISITDRI